MITYYTVDESKSVYSCFKGGTKPSERNPSRALKTTQIKKSGFGTKSSALILGRTRGQAVCICNAV
jgi:hypothetical protein